MSDPYLLTTMFAVFALVAGALIFGGITLAYILDQRRSDTPNPARGRPTGTKTSDAADTTHGQAA